VNKQNPQQSGATLPERSRVPIDPYSFFVDVMLGPDGQVITPAQGQAVGLSASMANFPTSNMPFYHFWICERGDVYDPLFNMTPPLVATNPQSAVPYCNTNIGAAQPQVYLLPMPQGTVGTWVNPANGAQTQVPYTGPPGSVNGPYLKGDMRLVTLFVKTGQVLTYDLGLSDFDPTDTNQPYMQAQFGVREAK
jgi:hypothetical protein